MSGVVSLRLTDAEKNRLDALAEKTGRPRAFYIREALGTYLDELEHIYSVRAEHEAARRREHATASREEREHEQSKD